ncbi:MAG: hypothetical protein RLZZ401_1133 [Pseudomonadota bacterium]
MVQYVPGPRQNQTTLRKAPTSAASNAFHYHRGQLSPMRSASDPALTMPLQWSRRWIYLGSRHAADAAAQRKLVQVNIGTLSALANVAVFNLIFFAVGNPALILSGLLQIPMALGMVIGVGWLNLTGKLTAARWVLYGSVMLDVTVTLTLLQGTALFIHGYFLVFAVLTPYFFPGRQWRSSLFLTLTNLGLYLAFQIYGWAPHPDMNLLTQQEVRVLSAIMGASCALAISVLLINGEYFAARNERELELMANTDSLTQLPNRRAFRARLTRDLEGSLRDARAMAVAMIDIDFFKQINDGHGHDVGDRVLQAVSQVLMAHMRADDTVARIGGEEFALLMPRTDAAQALVIAERLRHAVSEFSFGTTEVPLRLNVSIGLTSMEPGARADHALKAADAALYTAKSEGRNRVVVRHIQTGNV